MNKCKYCDQEKEQSVTEEGKIVTRDELCKDCYRLFIDMQNFFVREGDWVRFAAEVMRSVEVDEVQGPGSMRYTGPQLIGRI